MLILLDHHWRTGILDYKHAMGREEEQGTLEGERGVEEGMDPVAVAHARFYPLILKPPQPFSNHLHVTPKWVLSMGLEAMDDEIHR